MWIFCMRSLLREYGWRFVRRVALRHPWRTLKALRQAAGLDLSGASVEVPGAGAGSPVTTSLEIAEPLPSVVGAGFCLKPVGPPCPSGRANHDCAFLERPGSLEAAAIPAPCCPCTIREIGTRALRAGAAFYVMTSARDILEDVFVPALKPGRFPTGLFALCRYSFEPFALGLMATGMSGRLFPLEQGDCRDYKTWLLADRGIKHQQTAVDDSGLGAISRLLDAGGAPSSMVRVERRGNVFYPVSSAAVRSAGAGTPSFDGPVKRDAAWTS